jgi:hypothetical protein
MEKAEKHKPWCKSVHVCVRVGKEQMMTRGSCVSPIKNLRFHVGYTVCESSCTSLTTQLAQEYNRIAV